MSARIPPDPEPAERPACLHCKVPIYLDAEGVWCRKATGAAVCPRNTARDGHEPRPPATPPDVREVASLVEGEVWGWLNRADAPWSPSDKTVMDLTFAVARALAAAGVLASTPRPEGEFRAATQIAEAERLLALAESTDWTSEHEPYRAPAIAAAQAYATLAVAEATLAAARAAVPPVEQDGDAATPSSAPTCDKWCDPQTGVHAPWCTR